jgi:hypothetical protein
VTLLTGNTSFPVNQWHNVALRMNGSLLTVVINGQVVGSVADSRFTTGNAGLQVSGWQNAQFDDVAVMPTAAEPVFIPQAEMTVLASSEHDLFYLGDRYPADYILDGRPESVWHTRFNPRAPLPASLTFDLRTIRQVEALTYQPRLDNNANGMIARYNMYLSADGHSFNRVVTNGQWGVSSGTKIASWSSQPARFVRLEVLEGRGGDMATAGEMNIRATPLAADFDADGDIDGSDFLTWQRGLGAASPYGTRASGDADADLDVDGDDLTEWQTRFGMNAATSIGTSHVDEAAALMASLNAMNSHAPFALTPSLIDSVMTSESLRRSPPGHLRNDPELWFRDERIVRQAAMLGDLRRSRAPGSVAAQLNSTMERRRRSDSVGSWSDEQPALILGEDASRIGEVFESPLGDDAM